jgi:hypothetical protein
LLLPLLLLDPVVLLQEGVTFSLGMLTPDGNSQQIVESGFPVDVLFGLGIIFLFSGITWIGGLQPERCSTCRVGPFAVAPTSLLL